jgi:omega-6 fatty acid desaturase (delta-12 desaturase)
LFVVGPVFNFVVLQRVMITGPTKREWPSLLWTNLAIVLLATPFILAIGLKDFVLIYAPIMVVASSVGTWLFYVQHQFEQTYWVTDDEWDYTLAALKGSSYYNLPSILRWFTGNIGFHHVHHLSPRIPNYLLKQCHDENPVLRQATVLTLGSSLRTASLRLWDQETQRLVGFGNIDPASRPSRVESRRGGSRRAP